VGVSACTPEELETLFEDALTIQDRDMLAALFEEGAVLFASNERPVHGDAEIVRLALKTWQSDHSYIADPWHVIQARDIALVVMERGVNIARRGRDGGWRYAIVFALVDDGTERDQQ
jgi:ketosteroid isomerase-like protein